MTRDDGDGSMGARLARMRHDLRTPLNHIIGYTEILQEDAPQELQADLARVHEAAHNQLAGLDEAFATLRELVGEPPSAASGATTSMGQPHAASAHATGTGGAEPASPAVPEIPAPSVRPAAPEIPAPSVSPAAPEARAPSASSAAPKIPSGEAPLAEATLEQDAPILVVDDNAMNRHLLARPLRKLGLQVDEAADGEAALAAVAERPYSLILLDIMMPGLSGLEVLREIRAQHPMSELPVVMATAKDSSSDLVEALALGANDYVTKPINVAVATARCRAQLELRRANLQIRALARQLEARKRFIREAFGRYVTDEVVDSLLQTPDGLELGGESRTVTVLMSDLRDFSSLAERLSPSQVITLLNNYLARMTDVICKHGGTIDEFIGDAILVIFGAPAQHPDDALRAVACAVEMQLAMPQVNEANAAAGLPPIEMGIGINTGEVVVGNIGCQRRTKYGVVGRHVNLAGRIQSYSVGRQVLISEATRAAAGAGVEVAAHMEVSAKGARKPLSVYEVAAVRGPYDVALPRPTFELEELAEPLPVRFGILDGSHVPALEHEGRITHLSPRTMQLSTQVPVAPMRTLKLAIVAPGASAGVNEVYGKVVRAEASSLLVHLTSLSPVIQEALASLATAPR